MFYVCHVNNLSFTGGWIQLQESNSSLRWSEVLIVLLITLFIFQFVGIVSKYKSLCFLIILFQGMIFANFVCRVELVVRFFVLFFSFGFKNAHSNYCTIVALTQDTIFPLQIQTANQGSLCSV